MLVLTRRSGGQIIITDTLTGEQITIAVVEQIGTQTRIGIEASRRFNIVRRELMEGEPAGTEPR